MRQTKPELLGIVNPGEDGQITWLQTVYALPQGGHRLIAVKVRYEGKLTQTGEKLLQLPLLDVEGNPI